MSKIDILTQLIEEANQLCPTNKTNNWSNSWPWKDDELAYYHLIYQENDKTFHYKSITQLDIEIQYSNHYEKYRIDIKASYRRHNYWYFNEDKWKFVKEYVKNLIKLEYESLNESFKLVELSNDAHMEKEPLSMYEKMNYKFRKQKLKNICQ